MDGSADDNGRDSGSEWIVRSIEDRESFARLSFLFNSPRIEPRRLETMQNKTVHLEFRNVIAH